MSRNLILKVFRDQRWALPSYAIGVLGYCLAIIGVYPTVRENSQMFDDYVKQFPEPMMKAFGMDGETTMSSFSGFISAEFLSLIWVLIAAAFAIAFGSAMIAKEVESGTIELLLSAPVSRLRVFFSKIVVLVSGLLVIVVATIGSIWLGAQMVGAEMDLGRYAGVGLLGLGFFLAIGGYTVLFSSFSGDRGRPTLLAIVVTLLFYLVNFLSSYWDKMDWIKYLTLFHYYQPKQILDKGTMPWGDLAVYLVVAVVCVVAGAVVFKRRDITV